jgi:hypothetical protein
MLTFDDRTGRLTRQDGSLFAQGYSGADPDPSRKGEAGEGVNDPSRVRDRGVGPIPLGVWRIVGPPFTHEHAGKSVLRLLPEPGTETFGRDGFLIHGDSVRLPGSGSQGCVIIPGAENRERLWIEGDHLLRVIDSADPGLPIAMVPSH